MTRLRAIGPVVFTWLVFTAGTRAEADRPLVAGEPLLLAHPSINKSIGNSVHCLALINDGAQLATGAASGVFVWDVSTGKPAHTLEVDHRGVDSLVFEPHGGLLIAGGGSGVIKVWDTRTWKLVRTLGPAPGAVRGLAVSSDGKFLAAAAPNGQLGESDPDFGILLWNLRTGEALPKIAHPSPSFGTISLAFLPDSRRLVSAQDRTLRVVDLDSAGVVRSVEIPDLTRTIGQMAVVGNQWATGAFEPKLRIGNTDELKQVRSWEAHHREPPPRLGVASVNFSPDGRYVLSGGMDGMVCVWETATGRRLLELDGRGESSGRWITGVVMSADARLLAASHYGGTATIWRIRRQN